MSKLIVMYKKPADPAHFAQYFRDVHMPLVAKMPGLKSHSFGPATAPDGTDGDYFWVFVGTFDTVAEIDGALRSPEGQAALDDIPNYSPDNAPTVLYLDSVDG
jgi:uncharacterized protein (TIGR02118 family)